LTAGAGDGYIGEQIMANAYLGDGFCYSSGAAGADAELPNRLCSTDTDCINPSFPTCQNASGIPAKEKTCAEYVCLDCKFN